MQFLCLWTIFIWVFFCHVADGVEKRSPKYSIETRVFVDKHALQSWKTKLSTTDSDTKAALRTYIKSAFYDLNSIFAELSKSDIDMDARILSIEFVSETITASTAGAAESRDVIKDFQTWLSDKPYTAADHSMLLTGLDLTTKGSGSTSGVANLDRMCNLRSSVSVVEAAPSGRVVTTMAHELGHSLSAYHDGEGNECTAGNYIMSASNSLSDTSNQNFRFSTCTVDYFKDFFKSGDASCLSETTAKKTIASPLGKLYSPDKMCRMDKGPNSYLCRSFYGPGGDYDYSDVCSSILCQLPGENRCRTVVAANGFVCGQGKRCYLGDCVDDTTSSTGSATDTCPFGDVPVSQSHLGNATCQQAIGQFSGQCYSSWVQRSCCKSCQEVKTNSTDCAFGDKANWCSTLKGYQCYANDEACCSTCKKFQTDIDGCKYGDKQPWCPTLQAKQCYLNDKYCCQRCKGLEKTDLDSTCKYGDKADWCATMNLRNCPLNKQYCCDRCQ